MELKEREGVLAKVTSIIFAVYGIVVWVAKVSDYLLGTSLGAVLCSTAQKLKHHAPSPLASPLLSSSAISSGPESSSSILGDYLGSESGVHMSSEVQEIVIMKKRKSCKKNSQLKEAATKREFPPPIPPRPWVLTREYKDGRLIIRQQIIQNFETQREDDLLTIEELQSGEEEEEDDDDDDDGDDEEKNGAEEEKIEGEAIALPSDLLPEPVIEETGSENKADVQEPNAQRQLL